MKANTHFAQTVQNHFHLFILNQNYDFEFKFDKPSNEIEWATKFLPPSNEKLPDFIPERIWG